MNIAIPLAMIGFFALFIAGLTAILIKLFERRLSFVQTLLIAGWSVFPATLLLFVGLNPMLGIPRSVETLLGVVWMVLIAILITRRAKKKYGIESSGRLGLGGKVMLSLLAVSWVFVGIFYGLS